MGSFYKYHVLQMPSEPFRGEVLNVALLIESEHGIEVRTQSNLDKVRVISHAVDAAQLRHELLQIPSFLEKHGFGAGNVDAGRQYLCEFFPFRFGGYGSFDAPDRQYAEFQIQYLMKSLVEAEPAQPKEPKQRAVRLRRSIRQVLGEKGILALKTDGIDSHRVVSDLKLSEGVSVDFLLKNGAIHAFQAAETNDEDVSVARAIKDIAVAALTFEHVRMNFREQQVRPRLIYTASALVEHHIKPSLVAVQAQGANLVNWASADDQKSFIDEIYSVATPVDREGVTKDLFDIRSKILC